MSDQSMKLAVFCSGGGSNFQSIVDSAERGDLACDIVLCLCNKENTGALDRAARHNIPSIVLNPKMYDDEALYTAGLLDILDSYSTNFIALAGYLLKIPPTVVRKYHNRMLNIHPALLPSFGGKGLYGRRVHEAALSYGVRWSGVTIHIVDENYDTGPVVLQQPVPVLPGDTPEILAARVLKVEHQLYPRALRLFAEGRVTVEERRVLVDEDTLLPPDWKRLFL